MHLDQVRVMDFIRKIRLRQGEKVSLKIQSAVTLETQIIFINWHRIVICLQYFFLSP